MDRAQILQLHNSRQAYAEAKATADAMIQAVKDAYPDVFQAVEDAKTVLAVDEGLVRELSLAYFNETKDKHPGFGIVVKVTQTPEYESEKALEWAKINARYLIIPESLDTSGFGKLCKEIDSLPDFVTLTDKPVPSIPTDLSKYLEE